MTTDSQYTEDNREFYLNIPDWQSAGQRVTICQPANPSDDSSIRLYCTMFNTAWELQIRGFGQSRNYQKLKTWYYSSASLGVEELTALRDACNAALGEVS